MNIYYLKNTFIINKYNKLYFKIIEKAISESRKRLKKCDKNYVYYELHHILPRSIYPEFINLTKNPWNGVLLTAREHFICHKLLCRMFSDRKNKAKMYHAVVRCMHIKTRETIHTSREYEYYSIKASKEHSIFVKGNKYSLGKKWCTNIETGISKQFDKDKIPEGWVLGRNSFRKENNSVSGTSWYHNPLTRETGMFKPTDKIPDGWVKGRLLNNKGKKFYYDPITMKSKRFYPGEEPSGWTPGFGTIMGENHWNFKKRTYK